MKRRNFSASLILYRNPTTTSTISTGVLDMYSSSFLTRGARVLFVDGRSEGYSSPEISWNFLTPKRPSFHKLVPVSATLSMKRREYPIPLRIPFIFIVCIFLYSPPSNLQTDENPNRSFSL